MLQPCVSDVLAYSILKSIVYKLNQSNYHASWATIKKRVKTHMRATMIFNDSKGFRIHIRQTGLPEAKAAQIYTLLNVKVCKNQVISKHRV